MIIFTPQPNSLTAIQTYQLTSLFAYELTSLPAHQRPGTYVATLKQIFLACPKTLGGSTNHPVFKPWGFAPTIKVENWILAGLV
jgi:hypothetical protein